MDKINTRDRDSLAALESLLRIRSSGQHTVESMQQQQQQQDVLVTPLDHHHQHTQKKQPQAPSPSDVQSQSLLSQFSNSGTVNSCAAGLFPSYARVQLAAARAAIAAATSSTTQYPRVPNPLQNFVPIHHQQQQQSDQYEQSQGKEVRKEKVEEALRSKPQRGRKRDDLSAKERQELTRTRNREHAKTTRIRKKARYEELLECEAKLIVYKEEQERKDLCCKAIENFLSLRQNMIRCCVTMKKEQQEEKAESSTNSISPTTSTTPTTRPVNHSAVLGHLVEKMEDFHHIVKSSSGGALEATQTENHSKEEICSPSLRLMTYFDQLVADRVVQKYGIGAERYLVYKHDTICLDSNGTSAFCKVELSMDLSKNNITTILSFFLVAKFETNSVRLSSVEWTTLQDHCSSLEHHHTGNGGGDASINATTNSTTMMRRNHPSCIFPSVVSLDQSKTRKVSSASIGMNL